MSQPVPPPLVALPPSPEQRVLHVLQNNAGKNQMSLSEIFCRVPHSTSMPVVMMALMKLWRSGRVQMDDTGFWTLSQMKEILFKDVKPGQPFQFTMQLLQAKAVKAVDATAVYGDGNNRLSNLVITEVLFVAPNIPRVPGDYEWLPEDAIVLVDP